MIILQSGRFGAGGGSPTAAYEAEVIGDGPLAYWPMNEPSGTAMEDASGNNRDGIYQNTPTLAASGPGGGSAVTFNGSNEFATADSTPFRTVNFTVEVWLKTTSQSWQSAVAHPAGVAGPYGYNVFVEQTTSRVRCEIHIGGPVDRYSTSVVDDGNWHHVVFTDDGTDVKIYVDGSLELTGTEGGTIAYYTSSTGMNIGAQETSGGSQQYYFNGSLAHVALYDYALTGTQVSDHFAAM